MVLGIY